MPTPRSDGVELMRADADITSLRLIRISAGIGLRTLLAVLNTTRPAVKLLRGSSYFAPAGSMRPRMVSNTRRQPRKSLLSRPRYDNPQGPTLA